jgi:regulator of protease activity HflC (stomatin/prohibitin superfamily)
MIKQINTVSGENTDKQRAEGLNTARIWLAEARKGAENKGKGREASKI